MDGGNKCEGGEVGEGGGDGVVGMDKTHKQADGEIAVIHEFSS